MNIKAINWRPVWMWFCALAFILPMGIATAQIVGAVTDLSGPLLGKKPNGVVKVLAKNSTVEPGDLLESQEKTYARIKFLDNSEITLRPNTQFKIEKFSFDESKPENDSSIFSLIKGGLRSITGALGRRNKERYQLNTLAATIGIRGTTYIAELNRGLYVQVLDGEILLANGGGTQNFSTGQFGYAPSYYVPPVILPNNPGLKFNPPTFSAKTKVQSSWISSPEEADCN